MPVLSETHDEHGITSAAVLKPPVWARKAIRFAPGTVFVGTQKSGGSKKGPYDVTIELHAVETETFSGYFTILSLTPANPRLVTFFQAEVVSSSEGFLTGKWGATFENDTKHWAKLPGFTSEHARAFKEGTDMDLRDSATIFFRLKEEFLVPDHKDRSISGISWSGFYYCALDREDGGQMRGIYFAGDRNTAAFQSFLLTLDKSERGSPSYAFR
jgi:hypothetical protein